MTLTSGDMAFSAVVQQAEEPTRKIPGMLWFDTSGSNIEMHQWNEAGGVWETWLARGPDAPTYPVEGSLWRDTGVGRLNQYDGAEWMGVGVAQSDVFVPQPVNLWYDPTVATTALYEDLTSYSSGTEAYSDLHEYNVDFTDFSFVQVRYTWYRTSNQDADYDMTTSEWGNWGWSPDYGSGNNTVTKNLDVRDVDGTVNFDADASGDSYGTVGVRDFGIYRPITLQET